MTINKYVHNTQDTEITHTQKRYYGLIYFNTLNKRKVIKNREKINGRNQTTNLLLIAINLMKKITINE